MKKDAKVGIFMRISIFIHFWAKRYRYLYQKDCGNVAIFTKLSTFLYFAPKPYRYLHPKNKQKPYKSGDFQKCYWYIEAENTFFGFAIPHCVHISCPRFIPDTPEVCNIPLGFWRDI